MTSTVRSLTRGALAAFALTALAACAKKDAEPEAASAAPAARDPNAPLHVANTGLATPESVLWDATREIWYVSNINGQAPQKDDNGYIVRLGANGETMDSLPFISGADDDVTLHAPKGMAMRGDTLWVTDIDALRTSGKQVASIDLAPLRARFLNDVAIGNDGGIYITDSGIAFSATGAVSHPGQSQVFVVRNGVPTVAVTLPKQSAANGIAWSDSRNAWMIVGFNSPNIFEWVIGAKEASVLGTAAGGGDGLVVLADGRAIYSSWADSSLNVFVGGTSTTLRKGLNAPADLGYDPVRKLIAVPLFSDNRVEFWPVDDAPAPAAAPARKP
jgi:sugar lactone lactonase YvrE